MAASIPTVTHKKLPLYGFIVKSEGGLSSFRGKREQFADKPLDQLIGQPRPLITMRENWIPSPANLPLLTFHENSAEPSVSLNAILASPMPRFENNQVVNSLRWKQQRDAMMEFLGDMMATQWMSSDSATALLGTLRRGIEDYATTSHVCFSISDDKLHTPNGSNVRYPPQQETAHGNFSLGFSSPQRAVQHMANCRFYFNIVNFTGNHWGSFIWDREKGHLYVFDSGKNQRRQRLRLMAAAWRQFLIGCNLPFGFTVFGIPTTPQPSEWECGYLAIFFLWTTLRGLVGRHLMTRDSPIQPLTIDLDGEQCKLASRDPSQLPELPITDWACVPDLKRSFQAVQEFLMGVALNDIGFLRPSFSTSGDKGAAPTQVTFPFPWEPLDQMRQHNPANGWMFSNLGGPHLWKETSHDLNRYPFPDVRIFPLTSNSMALRSLTWLPALPAPLLLPLPAIRDPLKGRYISRMPATNPAPVRIPDYNGWIFPKPGLPTVSYAGSIRSNDSPRPSQSGDIVMTSPKPNPQSPASTKSAHTIVPPQSLVNTETRLVLSSLATHSLGQIPSSPHASSRLSSRPGSLSSIPMSQLPSIVGVMRQPSQSRSDYPSTALLPSTRSVPATSSSADAEVVLHSDVFPSGSFTVQQGLFRNKGDFTRRNLANQGINWSACGAGGRVMTEGAATALRPRKDNAPVIELPKTNTFITTVPSGMMTMTNWGSVKQALDRDVAKAAYGTTGFSRPKGRSARVTRSQSIDAEDQQKKDAATEHQQRFNRWLQAARDIGEEDQMELDP